MDELIVGPLKTIRIRTLIIIDECKDKELASWLFRYSLAVWTGSRSSSSFHRSSRTWDPLWIPAKITPALLRHHDIELSLDGDVGLFFRARLADIAKTRSDCNLTEDWPSSFSSMPQQLPNLLHPNTKNPAEACSHTSFPQSTFIEKKLRIDLLYTQVPEHAFHDIGTRLPKTT